MLGSQQSRNVKLQWEAIINRAAIVGERRVAIIEALVSVREELTRQLAEGLVSLATIVEAAASLDFSALQSLIQVMIDVNRLEPLPPEVAARLADRVAYAVGEFEAPEQMRKIIRDYAPLGELELDDDD